MEIPYRRIREDYLSGFLVGLIILAISTLLEWINMGRGIFLPSWPLNALIGVSFAFILVFLHIFYSDYDSVKWLARVPASISSVVLFTFLTLILGLSIQNDPHASKILKITGLSHVRTSFAFLFSGMYLLTTLGLVILRRFKKITFRNIGFLLNHLGLWIIIFAGSLGAGDVIRLNIFVNENESSSIGYTDNRQAVNLPFRVKLLDFSIEEFNTKLVFVNNSDMSFAGEFENNLIMLQEGLEFEIAEWEFKVLEYLNSAIMDSAGVYIPSSDTLAYPVARIFALNRQTDQELKGYISCGNKIIPPKFLKLDNQHTLAMSFPEPKEYSSLLELIDSKARVDTLKLIVNKPIKIDGYDLYQLSYDEKMGKWSKLSVINAIKDPWLPVIYIGIFMLIAGSLYLFTIGKTPNEDLK
ncbi:MAG: cytochrome c biogenesis protein ResB [Bacteroidales bacterium]|nr:cytochrome c biogenesis protein ResB [Bacteroidales bacterium]